MFSQIEVSSAFVSARTQCHQSDTWTFLEDENIVVV